MHPLQSTIFKVRTDLFQFTRFNVASQYSVGSRGDKVHVSVWIVSHGTQELVLAIVAMPSRLDDFFVSQQFKGRFPLGRGWWVDPQDRVGIARDGKDGLATFGRSAAVPLVPTDAKVTVQRYDVVTILGCRIDPEQISSVLGHSCRRN